MNGLCLMKKNLKIIKKITFKINNMLINTIGEISIQEQEFKKLYPDSYIRYRLYANYYILKSGRNMNSKDYETVLVKSLISYFLYKENKVIKESKVTLTMIGRLLGYASHTGVVKSIKKIENLLRMQPNYKIYNMINMCIKDYFVVFNNIFIKSIKNKK